MKTLRLTPAQHARLTHPGRDAANADIYDDGSPSEREFAAQLRHHGLTFEREYQFAKNRKWRADFAFLEQRVIVEVDGDVHRLRNRFAGDREKLNAATLQGWRYLRFGPKEVDNGLAAAMTIALLKQQNEARTPSHTSARA